MNKIKLKFSKKIRNAFHPLCVSLHKCDAEKLRNSLLKEGMPFIEQSRLFLVKMENHYRIRLGYVLMTDNVSYAKARRIVCEKKNTLRHGIRIYG